MKKFHVVSISTFALASLAFGATPQKIQPIPSRDLIENGMFLLNDPGVVSNLTISSSQRNSIQSAFQTCNKALQSIGPNDSDAASLRAEDGCEKEVENVLTPAQMTQLKQLTIKTLGVDLYRLQPVLDRLKLTPAQAQFIATDIAQIDLKQDDYDNALADKLAALAYASNDKLSDEQIEQLQADQKKVIDSFKSQSDDLVALQKRTLKQIQDSLTADQKQHLQD